MRVDDHPSPNCGPRRDGLLPELIVIHYTAMNSAEAALERLCDPLAEVSAHYLISGQGAVTRLVAEDQRAWHAGAGQWRGMVDINSRSIGIELDNKGNHPFAEPQMAALCTLLQHIMQRWAIKPAGLIGHSDMAPGRKVDPGPRFDWARLARMGLALPSGEGHWDDPPDAHVFRRMAQHVGYTAEADDETLLQAVRLRHRQNAVGPLHPDDFAALPQTL